MSFTLFYAIVRTTAKEWIEDNAPRLGASLAFYSILSLGPLLLIVLSVGSLFFSHEAVSGHVFSEIRDLVGDESAQAIEAILSHTQNRQTGIWSTIIGLVTLLLAVTGVFCELQDALNIIWKVKTPKNGGVLVLFKKRLLSFAMVLTIGFLLLISLVISSVLYAFSHYFSPVIPSILLHALNFIVSFAVTTLLFAMIFKILPDIIVTWRDVGIGSVITSILFTIGKQLISLYIGHSTFSSTYGAAGSLIVVLVWIYYSTQILFLGAEFTQVYTRSTKR